MTVWRASLLNFTRKMTADYHISGDGLFGAVTGTSHVFCPLHI